jgi:hypothetical protein
MMFEVSPHTSLSPPTRPILSSVPFRISPYHLQGEIKDHLGNLKPLGLNCLLNNCCNIAPALQSQYEVCTFLSLL